jgi:adenylosuccinate synthase
MEQSAIWPEGVNVLAVICLQFGDTGKGKIVDLCAEEADIIARGTGGSNAGHTICANGRTHITHIIPSSISYTDKTHIIGNGVAFNPQIVMQELKLLDDEKIPYDNLRIALNAKLTLPHHLLIDRAKEKGAGKIGTTGQGIAPTYVDHHNRIGLMVNDTLNPDIFRSKLNRNLEYNQRIIASYNPEDIAEIMQHPALGGGIFYRNGSFDIDQIIASYMEYGKRFMPMITDTDKFLREAVRDGKRVVLEGAQGALLSILLGLGTYPYVTSSNASIGGLAEGVGLSVDEVNRIFGIAKVPYMTRVGNGPFPTELGGARSAEHCRTKGVNRESELEQYPTNLSKSDDFQLGISLRQVGNEYGATTGRPRRIGWLDLPLLCHAVNSINSNKLELVLTKMDVLTGYPHIKICDGYSYDGPTQRYGGRVLSKGTILTEAIPYAEVIEHCQPMYQGFPGWENDISGVESVDDLPPQLVTITSFIEKSAKAPISLLSVGKDREQTISYRAH